MIGGEILTCITHYTANFGLYLKINNEREWPMMLNVVSMTMDGDGWWMVWLSIDSFALWFLVDCVNDRYYLGVGDAMVVNDQL